MQVSRDSLTIRHVTMLCSILATLLTFQAQSQAAEETSTLSAVVYGSFSSQRAAENAANKMAAEGFTELIISPVMISGRLWFRLHSNPSLDMDELRQVLKAARAGPATDAWITRITPAERRSAVSSPSTIAPSQTKTRSARKAAIETDAPSIPPDEGKPSGISVATPESVMIIPKISTPAISLDGQLNESLWQDIPAFDLMTVVDPDTAASPRHATLTRLFYSDNGLYVGIEARQPATTLLARLSSRDQDINRDGVTVYLDTSGHSQYGHYFGVNLGGSLNDGSLLPERQVSPLWDGPWRGTSQITAAGFTTELFLPWSMMSMPEISGSRTMNFAVQRRVAYLDEEWGFPALPKSRPAFMSGFQPIQLEAVSPKQQLAFYPFAAATRDRIYNQTSYRVGTDIFWRPSSNLQLTATINPDFGTVESDDVVVNLTAFETFYPEKRLFFLEGNETFITSPRAVVRGPEKSPGARQVPNSFTLQPNTLVNTRRIGGAPITPLIPADVLIPDVELSKPTELAGALKMTGQSGPFRYGVLAASEEDSRFYGSFLDGRPATLDQVGRDFGVVRLLYEDAGIGRRSVGIISTIMDHPDRRAQTHGMDIHYRSPRSQLIADAQLVFSEVNGVTGKGGFIDMNYIPRRGLLHRFSYDHFDDLLVVDDLGYFRRNDVITWRYSFNHQTSNLKHFRYEVDWLTFSHETNTDGRTVRSSIFYRNTLTFNNKNQLHSTMMWRPRQWDDKTSEGNGDFRTEEGGVAEFAYGTDTSKKVSLALAVNGMSEALGDWSYMAKGGLTYKPNDRFSFDLDFMYRKTNNWIIHLAGNTLGAYDARHWQPSIAMEAFLSARQQLRFSMQWVGIKADATDLYQVPTGDGDLIRITNGMVAPTYDFTISRITAQLRYRWEIAPLSDLFIVYTRGSNLPNQQEGDFEDLFRQAAAEPVIDRFVIKLRYRFGN